MGRTASSLLASFEAVEASGSPIRMKTSCQARSSSSCWFSVSLAEVEMSERLQELGLERLVSLAGEGDGPGDEGLGIGLGEDAVLPELHVLVLERDPRGVANEAVLLSR